MTKVNRTRVLAGGDGAASGRKLAAAAGVAVTVGLWGAAFVAIRAAVASYGPYALTVARLVVASIAFAAAVPFVGLARPATSDLPALAVSGVFGLAAYQLLLNLGETSVSATTASIVLATAPLLTAVLAHARLGERLGYRGGAGMVLALVGVGMVSIAQDGSFEVNLGAILVLVAAAFHAGYFISMKELLRRYRPFDITVWATWIGAASTLPMLPALLAVDAPLAWHTGSGLVLFLGVGVSAVGFFAWNIVLASMDASRAVRFLYLVPVVSATLAWFLLGETPSVHVLAGGALVLFGVALGRRSR